MVWMRTAALPTFRKLYGRIETDLEANEKITVVIQNNYNTYSFDGKKKLVISTATWIGGKNDFLGRMYLVVGGTSLLLALVFSLLYIFKPRYHTFIHLILIILIIKTQTHMRRSSHFAGLWGILRICRGTEILHFNRHFVFDIATLM